MEGLDLSNNNGGSIPTDFATCAFAFSKATESTTFVDSYFAHYATLCGQHGLIEGAYHFSHPDANSPNAEADFFLAHSGNAVLLALDVEPRAGRDPLAIMGAKGLAGWVNDWCNRVLSIHGIAPFIYLNKSYLSALSPFLGAWPIWLATLNGHPQAPSYAGRIVSIEQYAIVNGFDRDIAYVDLGHPHPDPTPTTEDDVHCIVSDPHKSGSDKNTIVFQLRSDGLVYLRNVVENAPWTNLGPIDSTYGHPVSVSAAFEPDGALQVTVETDKGTIVNCGFPPNSSTPNKWVPLGGAK